MNWTELDLTVGDNSMFEHVVFVDTETTGLDPDVHEIWEAATVWWDPDLGWASEVWDLPVDLSRADPIALKIGGYHNRKRPCLTALETKSLIPSFAATFERITRGQHIVGAVPSFDEERLRKLLRANGKCPMWHYHLVDVEALVAGKLGIPPPWKSDDLSRAAGVDPDLFDRHTALGDALWARALYTVALTHEA